MVRKKRIKASKPIGIIKDGARFRLAFGTRANPRKGRKMFNSRKTIMAYAKKKGFVK